MHTEFYRERAQPGMVVIGSDSHTCSSGAVGCLAIGLGVADVTMALVTGEIWFRVPECVNIRLVGQPSKGIGGKDVILYILQQLKRNTVAADRVVEYTGPGLEHLSPDARFAISNMTTVSILRHQSRLLHSHGIGVRRHNGNIRAGCDHQHVRQLEKSQSA